MPLLCAIVMKHKHFGKNAILSKILSLYFFLLEGIAQSHILHKYNTPKVLDKHVSCCLPPLYSHSIFFFVSSYKFWYLTASFGTREIVIFRWFKMHFTCHLRFIILVIFFLFFCGGSILQETYNVYLSNIHFELFDRYCAIEGRYKGVLKKLFL